MYERAGRYKGDLDKLAAELTRFETVESPSGYIASAKADEAEIIRLIKPRLSKALPPGEWLHVLLTTIYPNGMIPMHRDGKKPGRRYHVVLQTERGGAFCYHDGDWSHMERGGIYRIDPTLPHGSVNWGAKPRRHIVIDIQEESANAN